MRYGPRVPDSQSLGGRRGRHSRPGLGRRGKGPGRHKGSASKPGAFVRWLLGRRSQ